MLNAEKYRDEIMNNCKCKFGFSNHIVKCEFEECPSCLFSNMNNDESLSCTVRKVKWLLSEHKEPIKLSKLEYDILKYLSDNTKCMYIVRDENGNIFLYDVEPQKNNSATWWVGRGMAAIKPFNKLFQFIKWEDKEPTSIKDALENCEVVDDE